ncbi:MAG: hypothetical protein K6B14_10705 [Lachnospiraceae bacterium]|nr:hypothetical protein [Lachnospiraceae bacterium]
MTDPNQVKRLQSASKVSHVYSTDEKHSESDKRVVTKEGAPEAEAVKSTTGPVPEAARKKNLSESVRVFFGGKTDEQIETEKRNMEEGQEKLMDRLEDETRKGLVNPRLVEIGQRQRETAADLAKSQFIYGLSNLLLAEESQPRYAGASEKAQGIIKGLSFFVYNRTLPGGETSIDHSSVDEAMSFLAEYGADLKKLNEGDPATFATRQQEFTDKYRKRGLQDQDHELLRAYAPQCAGLFGNQDLESQIGKSKVLDFRSNDGMFFEDKSTGKKNAIITAPGAMVECKVVEFKGPLFRHDPAPSDVRQGDMGDCYFISAVNSVVEKNPDFIRDMMQDKGDHVIVRFYDKDNKPVFVKVSKTLSTFQTKNQFGTSASQFYNCATNGGGAIWLSFLEKAYAVARPQIEPDRSYRSKIQGMVKKNGVQYDGIRNGGYSKNALRHILGPALKDQEEVSLVHFYPRESIDVKDFLSKMRGERKDREAEKAKKDGKKLSNAQWNIQKAKLFFGVDIKDENDVNYKLFSNDEVFEEIEGYVNAFLKENFTGTRITDDVDMLFLIEKLSNYSAKWPRINAVGYDEEKMKKHYLNYLKSYAVNNKFLRRTINRDGNYSDAELEDYKKIQDALTANKIVSAGIRQYGFALKKKEGQSAGEKVIFGLPGRHAYSVRGVTEEDRSISGKTVRQRFVLLVNPWKNMIRQYDRNGMPYMVKDDANTGTVTGGVFKMELSDFLHHCDHLSFS